jgi:SAM-dependent methyltransferase
MVHLHDPLKAMTQLKNILKPQGRLIIAELDNQTWYSYPNNEYLQKDVKLLCETGKLRGIDLEIGNKLYSYFRKIHMNNIKVEIAQPVLYKKDREYLISKVQAWSQRYIEHKLITESELETLFAHIKELVLNEDYLLAGARMFQVAGTV